MTKTHLLPGVILPDGTVKPRPVIVSLNDAGGVEQWRYLDGHEPPFTTPLPALLRLSDRSLASAQRRG